MHITNSGIIPKKNECLPSICSLVYSIQITLHYPRALSSRGMPADLLRNMKPAVLNIKWPVHGESSMRKCLLCICG